MMFACIINQLINNDIKIYANLSMHTNSIFICRIVKALLVKAITKLGKGQ